ncbi:MAG: cysteine hydrolase [Bradyrhizobiaceae bacterium]|nr:cysteine hydrolase [Bradyrhizobiaceae bacterium]
MHAPRTLLQMAGASGATTPLAESTVVIIDAQCEYVDGRVPLHDVDAALDAIGRLLELARKAGAPVIHVVHRGRAGGLFDPLGKMFQIHPKAAPAAGEKIIEKELPNAFARTPLHLALQAAQRQSLVLAGFMTHLCVSSTARAALDHGWRTTVVADACTTRDLPDPLGGDAISAAAVHRAALAELADRFATVVRMADLGN